MTEMRGRVPAGDDFSLAAADTPLARVIRTEIEDRGPITFERFMDLALGHPLYGYYCRPEFAWGRDGDFETSPEVHPVFGYLWARQIVECWERMGSPAPFELLEIGGGSGAFCASIMTWLRERAPTCHQAMRVTVIDGHRHRLEAQRRYLEARGHRAQHRLLGEWLRDERPVTGIIISNEFWDALPVHLVERRDDGLREWHVARDASGFVLKLGEVSTQALPDTFRRLELWPAEGCRAEVSLAASRLMAQIARRVERGYQISIDYGYPARRLYAPWRRMGTLMAFRNHSPQPDPLHAPGLQDLTAHVDFTSLEAAALDGGEGWRSAPTVSQTEALFALGLPEALRGAAERAASDLARFAESRRAAATLTDMEGLGRVRVLVLARSAPIDGLRCLQPAAAAPANAASPGGPHPVRE